MFCLKVENARGEIFELTHDTKNYAIVHVDGLTPPKSLINTSVGGVMDGAFYNSARVDQRNIVLTVVLNGDIEGNRQRLYKMFPQKSPCIIYFSNANRNVKITGYVEAMEADLFVQREQMQISLICPRPFWESLEVLYHELSRITKLFEFPFAISTPIPFSEILSTPLCTIKNDGDVECGCVITVEISDAVSDLKIYNMTTGELFGFDYNFIAGDEVTISTVSGKMGVSMKRSGETINMLNYVTSNSSWFRLALGDNDFTFRSKGGADDVRIKFATSILYGGV